MNLLCRIEGGKPDINESVGISAVLLTVIWGDSPFGLRLINTGEQKRVAPESTQLL